MSLKLSQLDERLRARIESQLAAEDAGKAARHLHPDIAGPVAVVECHPRNAPLAKKEVQRPVGQRFLVRVISHRHRLLDPDNLCEKYHLDLCRYAGCIPDDTAAEIKLETSQRKASKAEAEVTEIIIEVI